MYKSSAGEHPCIDAGGAIKQIPRAHNQTEPRIQYLALALTELSGGHCVEVSVSKTTNTHENT